jgi:CRP/FNR family transcriptional regulator, cyclic AMP receptor protein
MSIEIPGGLHEPDNTEPATRERNPESQPVTIEELRGLAFFRGLSDGLLAQIARYSKRVHFETGDAILKQGELANRFYVLTRGRALVQYEANGTPVPIQDLGPGDELGFSWVFSPGKLHFDVSAETPVEAIFFYAGLLREECDFDAELGYELLHRTGQVMMQRMEALAAKLAQAIVR